MDPIEKALHGFPVRVNIDVQWGEMDLAGHVNNVIYLKWFEHARVAYLDRLAPVRAALAKQRDHLALVRALRPR